MISVIIPLFNRARIIGQTLESIVSQTYQDIEIIIVNDGSTDMAQAAVEKFLAEHKNLTVSVRFFNQENKGAPAARNRGLREAAGEYVLFCDADARLVPQALALMLEALENNPQASYAYPNFLWGRKLFKIGPFSAERLRQGPMIHTMALVRRKDLPAGGWDESIKKLQDWDLWLTMLEDGKTGVWIDQTLFQIETGGVYSSWVPSFAYRWLPWLKAVKKYNTALAIVKTKHRLS